jgi:peptidoglycan hydrolase CwlO-like protein
MIEQIVLIKNFILNSPATADEHDKMLNMLQQVTQHFQRQIEQLTKEVEKLNQEKDGVE